MGLMTNIERRMAAEALAQLLTGEGNFTKAQWQAAHSALYKLRRPDPARALRECLNVAYTAFSRDDDGPVWSDTLIAKSRRVLKATAHKSNGEQNASDRQQMRPLPKLAIPLPGRHWGMRA